MMDEYSIRLSKAGDPEQLLGSGTLILRQRDRQAFLLTCAHVVRGLEDGEDFRVEYYANQGVDSTKILRPKEGSLQCGRGAFDVPEEDLPVGEDYVCYPLPWEPWMEKLPGTRWERQELLQRLSGFGFPEEKNGVYSERAPMGGGNALNAEVTNRAPNDGCFYCRFLDRTLLSLDKELLGFSGTGLFDSDGRLVGMVKGRNSARDSVEHYDFAAVAVSEVLRSLYRTHPAKSSWEDAALVRWLSNPLRRDDSDEPVLAMAAKTVNLWCLLLVLREPVVIILLNRSGSLKKALSEMDWLDAHWEAVSADSGEPSFHGNLGIVYTVPYRRLNGVQEILKSWRLLGHNMPFLLHIDLTEDTAGSLRLTDRLFWERVAGQKRYILLASENYFVPGLLSEGCEISDTEIRENLCTGTPTALYDRLLDCVQRHPLDMGYLLGRLQTEADGWRQKAVLCRLALLYHKLTGEDITAFVEKSYHRALPFLSAGEMFGLFWYLPGAGGADWDEETDALYENVCWLKERLEERDWAELAEFLTEHDTAYLDQTIEWIDRRQQEDFDGLCEAFSRLQGGTTYELIMSLRSRWGMVRLRTWTEDPCYSALLSALSRTRPCSGDVALDQMAAYVWQRATP